MRHLDLRLTLIRPHRNRVSEQSQLFERPCLRRSHASASGLIQDKPSHVPTLGLLEGAGGSRLATVKVCSVDRARNQTLNSQAGRLDASAQRRNGSTKHASALAELLQRVAEHDKASFAELYDATAAKLYGLIFRMVRRRDVSDDILQDVYARIWERAGDFDERKGSAMAWMGTIARNTTIDELRRSSSQSLPAAADGKVVEIASDDIGPLAALERSQDLDRLMDCLNKLEPERRDAVLLAYRDGLSRDDLSRRFSRPVGTIKTWIYRSVVQLRNCLDQ